MDLLYGDVHTVTTGRLLTLFRLDGLCLGNCAQITGKPEVVSGACCVPLVCQVIDRDAL